MKWIKNISLTTFFVSVFWILGKISRLWVLYVSSRHYLTDEQWNAFCSITILDKIFMVAVVASLIIYCLYSKLIKKSGTKKN